MDFSHENNLSFEAGAYDSILYPVLNFNELDEYPKQYVVTRNPAGNDPKMVIMDNAELKTMRSIENKPLYAPNIENYPKSCRVNKNSLFRDENELKNSGTIVRTNIESFVNLLDKDDRMKWLLFFILIIFVSFIVQIFNTYTNNMILQNLITIQNIKLSER